MRIVVGVLIVLALIGGGWAIASQSYRAGYVQGLAQGPTPSAPGEQPAPAPGPGFRPYPMWGYPYHGPGPFFGFFGLLWTVLIIFLIFSLIRGLFWRHGWSAYGPGGKGVPAMFEEWHRRAHEGGGRTSAV
jgi:hypothetical protein